MKFLVIATAFFVVTLAAHQDPTEVHRKCQNDPATHIDDEVFKDLQKNHEKANLPANFGLHMLCMLKGLNMMTEDGKADKEHIKSHAEHALNDAAKVDAVVAECAVDKATAEETATHIWGCLHKNHVMRGHRHSSEESNESDSDEHHHQHHHH